MSTDGDRTKVNSIRDALLQDPALLNLRSGRLLEDIRARFSASRNTCLRAIRSARRATGDTRRRRRLAP